MESAAILASTSLAGPVQWLSYGSNMGVSLPRFLWRSLILSRASITVTLFLRSFWTHFLYCGRLMPFFALSEYCSGTVKSLSGTGTTMSLTPRASSESLKAMICGVLSFQRLVALSRLSCKNSHPSLPWTTHVTSSVVLPHFFMSSTICLWSSEANDWAGHKMHKAKSATRALLFVILRRSRRIQSFKTLGLSLAFRMTLARWKTLITNHQPLFTNH